MNFNRIVSLTHTSNPNLRPLGAFEEMLWLADQHRPLHFLLAAEVAGSTKIEDWRRALGELQRRHPLFSVRIERNGNSRPSFRKDSSAAIPLRIVQADNATRRWELEAELELSLPFGPAQAPLVRAVLLHEERRSVCLLVTHHSIADGRSVSFAIRDWIEALAGRPLHPLPVIPSHEEMLGVTADETNGPVPTHQTDSPAVQPAAFVEADQLRPRVKSWPLTVELSTRLRVRARQEGTTVHGALSAAFVLAFWEVLGEVRTEPLRILSPIDTRQLLGLGDDCALLVDAAAVTFEPPEATTFWEIARTAMARLRPAQRLENITAARRGFHLIMQQGVDVPAAANMLAQGFAHEILLSNLGNLPYPTDFGKLRLEAVWGPIVSSRLKDAHTVGVTTTNGVLRLIQSSFAAPETLLETVEEILITACATRRQVTLAQLPS
jgi:Condensation domain